MDQAIKDQWLLALRGEEFRQGKYKLRSSDGLCCMGVLCVLHSRATGQKFLQDSILHDGFMYLGETTILPEQVMLWAGLSERNPMVRVVGLGLRDIDREEPLIEESLGRLNDYYVGFKQIADAIEISL